MSKIKYLINHGVHLHHNNLSGLSSLDCLKPKLQKLEKLGTDLKLASANFIGLFLLLSEIKSRNHLNCHKVFLGYKYKV